MKDSYRQMMDEFAKIPDLTREEEVMLARKWIETKDPSVGDSIIRPALKHMGAYVWTLRATRQSLDDLMCECTLGLMRALETFDPDKGVRFVSYAAWWIRHFAVEYLTTQRTIAKTTRGAGSNKHACKFDRERMRLWAQHRYSRDEIVDAISAKFKTTREMVDNVLRWVDAKDVMLDAPKYDEEHEGFSSGVNALKSDWADPEAKAIDADTRRELETQVKAAISVLTSQEQELARRLMHDPDDMPTFGDIAAKFGKSKQRAQQIDVITRKKLRALLAPLRGIMPV